jgi:precorrin-3B C17-methyltransferase
LPADTPVAFCAAIGRPDEAISVMDLGAADPALADMRTLVLIGALTTRTISRPDGRPWLYTPRSVGALA